MYHRIRKSLRAKKQKKSETKGNSSGHAKKNKKDNDAQQDMELKKSTEPHKSTQANSKGTTANNDDPQQKTVGKTPEEVIKQLRNEILQEQSKISNLQKWLTTASNIDEGINEAQSALENFSESVSDMVDVLISKSNLNFETVAVLFEFAYQIPEIGGMLTPIKVIIAIVKKHEDVKTAINGLWKRLLSLLNKTTELVSWVKTKQIVGEGFDETLRMYLYLINECTVTMKRICDDREKKNFFGKVWNANSYIDEISSLEKKIDDVLESRIESNGIKTLLIAENNATIIAQLLKIANRVDRNTRQSQHNNLKTIENVLDSFSKDDERLILENTTEEMFMDGTREWIFNEFNSWVYCKDKKKRVLILTAPAGFGKSQIAYQLVNKNRLRSINASYFAGYDNNRRRNPIQILLSIAYHLFLHLLYVAYKLGSKNRLRSINASYFAGYDNNRRPNPIQILLCIAYHLFLHLLYVAYKLVSKNRHYNVIAWHFVRYNSTRRSNPKRMLLSIAYQLSLHLSDYKSKLEDIIRNLTKSELLGPDINLQDIFEMLLQTPLNNMTSTKTFVIIIDALDERNDNHDLLYCIKNNFCKLPLWLKVFITTRPEYPLIQELQDFEPMEINPSADDNNKKDLRKFFHNVLINKDHKLSNDLDVDQAIKELVTKSDGLFMVARFLADTMKSNKHNLTLEYIRRLPNGTEEFYKERFQKSIFPNDDWSESIAWKVLQLIVVAKQPMNLLLIGNIIKCELKDLDKAIQPLSLFLKLTSPDSKAITTSTYVSACHKSLVDWLTDTNREMKDFYVDSQKPNEHIGKYCIEFFDKERIACIGTTTNYNKCKQKPNRLEAKHCIKLFGRKQIACNDSTTKYNKHKKLPINFDHQSTIADYVFRYGIKHLYDANMLKEARQILLNVGWLLIAARIKDPYHIVKDYELLGHDDLVIRLIGRSIKLSSSALQNEGWKHIPCQLIGRLYSSVLKRSTNDQIYIQLMNFINRLKTFSYDFSWWCPIGPTWEQAETACLKVFKRHNHPIKFVSFNPDATLVVSCDSFRSNNSDEYLSTILIWDTKNDEIFKEVEINGRVLTGSWSDVGLKLVSYSYKSLELMVWNVTMEENQFNEQKKLYLGIKLNLTDNQYLWDIKVAISPNQNLVAIVGNGIDNIKIWNIVSDPIKLTDIQQQQSKSLYVAWSPDSTRMATYSTYFNRVCFWNVNINESKLDFAYEVPISNHGCKKKGFSFIDWSPTVPRVAVSDGNTIFIIDAENYTDQIVCQFLSNRFCHHLVWSPVGTKIGIASAESIEIWNINDSNCKCEWKQDIMGSDIYSLAWSKDGMKLMSGSFDHSVCIWSTLITTSTTLECNQLPDYATVEQEEDNYNVDKKDVVRKNDSLESFSPNKVDWKELISEQRLQSIQEHQKIKFEYVWLQYNHTMLIGHLFEKYDEIDKRMYIIARFWDANSGKYLDLKRGKKSSIEITKPNAKCAILKVNGVVCKSFCYDELMEPEITKKNIEVIYPHVRKNRWSVHGKFAFVPNYDPTPNIFTLIISNPSR